MPSEAYTSAAAVLAGKDQNAISSSDTGYLDVRGLKPPRGGELPRADTKSAALLRSVRASGLVGSAGGGGGVLSVRETQMVVAAAAVERGGGGVRARDDFLATARVSLRPASARPGQINYFSGTPARTNMDGRPGKTTHYSYTLGGK